MIFVTVGSDVPFDRLVRVIDEWAGTTGRTDVFAQIGNTNLKPAHLTYTNFLEPEEFARRVATASIIISHAGMGTILYALRSEKPILVMPRKGSLGETRNEHQLATAKRLLELGKISVAFDEASLRVSLDHLDEFKPREKITPFASEELLSALRDFVAKT
jgi:UDP-N-acetylglucosamine transferase subunit ALG13